MASAGPVLAGLGVRGIRHVEVLSEDEDTQTNHSTRCDGMTLSDQPKVHAPTDKANASGRLTRLRHRSPAVGISVTGYQARAMCRLSAIGILAMCAEAALRATLRDEQRRLMLFPLALFNQSPPCLISSRRRS